MASKLDFVEYVCDQINEIEPWSYWYLPLILLSLLEEFISSPPAPHVIDMKSYPYDGPFTPPAYIPLAQSAVP